MHSFVDASTEVSQSQPSVLTQNTNTSGKEAHICDLSPSEATGTVKQKKRRKSKKNKTQADSIQQSHATLAVSTSDWNEHNVFAHYLTQEFVNQCSVGMQGTQEDFDKVWKSCLDLSGVVSDLDGLYSVVRSIKRDIKGRNKRLTRNTIKNVNDMADQIMKKVMDITIELTRLNYLSHVQCLATLALPSNHSVHPGMLVVALLCLMARSIAQRNPECGSKAFHYLFRNSSYLISDGNRRECGIVLSECGLLLSKQSKYDEALKYYHRALELQQKLNPNSMDVAFSLNNIGNVLSEQSKYDEALEYHHIALELQQKLNPNSMDVASSLNNIGAVLSKQSKYDEALKYHHDALELQQKLNPNSMDVASSFGNIGNVLSEQSKYDEGFEYYHRALKLQQKLNPNSMDVASSLNNIGNVLYEQSKYDEAFECHRDALEFKQKLNPNSMDVASSLNNIGNVLSEQSKYDEALKYYRDALGLQQKLNPNSMDVASSLNNIGNVLSEQSKYDDALKYHHRALKLFQKINIPHDAINSLRGCLEILLSVPSLGSRYTELYENVIESCSNLIDLTWKETNEEKNPGMMFKYLNFVKIVHYLAVVNARRGDVEKANQLLMEASNEFGKAGLVHLQLRMAEEAYSMLKSASNERYQLAAKCAKLCESPEIGDILGALQWANVKYVHEKTEENREHVHQLLARLIPFQNGSGNCALIVQVHNCRHLWHSAQMEIFDSFMRSRKNSFRVSERARNMVCSILATLLSTLDQAFGDLVRNRLEVEHAVDLYFAPSFALRRDFEADLYRDKKNNCVMQHVPMNLPAAWNKWLKSKKSPLLVTSSSDGCKTFKLSENINSKDDLSKELVNSTLPLSSIVLDVMVKLFVLSDDTSLEQQSVDSEVFSKELNESLWFHLKNVCNQNPDGWLRQHEPWHSDLTLYVDRDLATWADEKLKQESLNIDPTLMEWFRSQCKEVKFSKESLDGDHEDIYKAICDVQPWRLFAADNIKKQDPKIDWRSSWWCELYDTANETKHVRIVPQTAATELQRRNGLAEKLNCSLGLSYSESALRPWSFAHAFLPVINALGDRDWHANVMNGVPVQPLKEIEDISHSFELSRKILRKLSEFSKLEKRGPSRDWLLAVLDDRADKEKQAPFKFEMTLKNIVLLSKEIKSVVGSDIEDPLITDDVFYFIAFILLRHAIFRFHRHSSLDRQMDLQLFFERCLNGAQSVVEKMMSTNPSSSYQLADQCFLALGAVKDPSTSHIPNDLTTEKARDKMLASEAHPSDVVFYLDICLKKSRSSASKDAVDMLIKESNYILERMEWLSLHLLEQAYELCHWSTWENVEGKRLELVRSIVKRTNDLTMHSRAMSFVSHSRMKVDIQFHDLKDINVGTLREKLELRNSAVIDNLTINDLLGQLDSAYEELYYFRLKLIDAERVRAAVNQTDVDKQPVVQAMSSVCAVQLSSLLTKIRHLLDQSLGAALMHHIYQYDSSLEPKDSKKQQVVNAMSNIHFPARDAIKYLSEQGHDPEKPFHLPESLVNFVTTECQGQAWMKDLINLNNIQKHVSASALEAIDLDGGEDPLDLLAARMKQPLPISSSFKEIFSSCSAPCDLSETLLEELMRINIIAKKSPGQAQRMLKKHLNDMDANGLQKRLTKEHNCKLEKEKCAALKLQSFVDNNETITIPILQLLRESLAGTRAFVVAVCESFDPMPSVVQGLISHGYGDDLAMHDI